MLQCESNCKATLTVLLTLVLVVARHIVGVLSSGFDSQDGYNHDAQHGCTLAFHRQSSSPCASYLITVSLSTLCASFGVPNASTPSVSAF